MSWEGNVYVTGSNPYPGQMRPVEGSQPDASGNFPLISDQGVGVNVYIAGGVGPSGALPVSQTNPVNISLSGVSISGVMEVTTSAGHPVEVTGSVYVINQSSGSSGGTVVISGTASVWVENLPATQSVLILQQPVEVSGNVGVVGTASVAVISLPQPLQVTGTVDVSGIVVVTSSEASPVWVTGAVLDVNIKNSTIYVTSTITGTVAVSETNPVTGVFVLNQPIGVSGNVGVSGTASVFIEGAAGALTVSLDSTGVFVQNWPTPITASISGATFESGALLVTGAITVTNEMSGTVDVTGTVSVDNFPAGITHVTATISGASFESGALLVTGNITVTNEMSGTVTVTSSIGAPVWTTGSVTVPQPLQVYGSGVFNTTGTVHVDNDHFDVVVTNNVNTVPTAPNPTQFYPVRLTDGTNYYNATGGGSGSGGGNTVLVPPINNPMTASLTLVAQTMSIVTLLGGTADRVAYQIFNDSNAALNIFYNSNSSNSQSLTIGSKQVYETTDLVFAGTIYGQWQASGTGFARVTEYTNNFGTTGTIAVTQGSGVEDTTLYPWMVKFPDYNMSAFGALRTAADYTLLDLSNKYAIDSFELDVTQSVSGNVAHAPLRAAVRLQTPTTSGAFGKIRTNTYFKYQTGRGQRFIITAVHDAPENNQERRWGYFDDNDGLFWRLSGSEFGFVRRTSTGGTPVDNFVTQSAFNHDKMDGTGPSQQKVDLTKGNIYEVDFQWLGVGKVDLYINGYPCHVIQNANTYNTVYMKTANLPLAAGVTNNAAVATSGSGFDFICANVSSEGGSLPASHGFSIGRTSLKTAITNAAQVPVMAIRLSQLYPSGTGVDNRILVVPTHVDIFAQPSSNNQNPRIDWQLVLNPTSITNASWSPVDLTNSGVEWDQSATAFSGGSIIMSGRFITNLQGASGLGGNSIYLDLGRFFDYQGRKLRRSAFAGTSDVLLLTAASTTAQNLDCDATFRWLEYK